MSITRRQLRQIIKEELIVLREVSDSPKTTTGFPGEIPVKIDRTKTIERLSQEMVSLKAQYAAAKTAVEKDALKVQLQDVTDQHYRLTQGASLV